MKRQTILWCCFLVLMSATVVLIIMLSRVDYGALYNQLKAPASTPGTYTVTSVSDGDTIVVKMNGNEERVRLIGIDTPETHRPNTPVQCYGPEASVFTKNTLLGKNVRLESDPLSSNRDRYDRLLRYVYVDDGLFNLKLLETGHAMAYTSFEFSKGVEFIRAEENAQSRRLGLWGACEVLIKNGVPQTNALNDGL